MTTVDQRAVPYMADVTAETFQEKPYLDANPDVAQAVRDGLVADGRTHFEAMGHAEGRKQAMSDDVIAARALKHEAIRGAGLVAPGAEREANGTSIPIDCLTDELASLAGIEPTDLVSAHGYDPDVQAVIDAHPDAWFLDAGAGLRPTYFRNVVNFEIVPYVTTDVLGIAERLPFVDGCFDFVLSAAVLEHVRDPFTAAAELVRVLKPGGELFCTVPFLQPYHGYPHHYFNMTRSGLASLFEADLTTVTHTVPPYLHPVHTLTWLVGSWAAGLPVPTREEFLDMRLSEFMEFTMHGQAFLAELSQDKQFELACGTMLHARKPIV